MEETKQTYENGSIQPYGIEPLTQEEAGYAPFGFTEQRGCGVCRWFQPSMNRCYVVQGAIIPTGLSDLFMPLRPEDQMAELMEDFAEEMAEMDMDIGQASLNEDVEEKQKTGLLARFFSRGKQKVDKPLFDTPSGFKVIGDNYWIAHYTNPYEDRDKEWFAEKAIDEDLAFMRESADYPELWRYHIGTPKQSPVKHGKAFAVTKAGRIVIAFGEFDNTPLADAFKAYYKEHPDQELSHGFFYDPEQKRDGVYHKFHTFEISTLPPGVAANPYTYFGIKTGEKNMPAANEKAIADLKSIIQGRLPEEEVNKVLQMAAAKSAELDQHVSYKGETKEETKEKSDPPALSADTQAILGAFDGLKSALAAMSGEIAGLKAAMKDDMMDDDEEGDGSKPKKKKEDKAQRPTAQALAPEIERMLKGLVEEKGMNEDAKKIDERDLDPAAFIMTKVLGGGK